MFDDVTCTAMGCPLCGQAMGWQSKDGDCLLEQLTALQLHEKADPATFYASCPDCHVWIEVAVRSNKGRTPAQWAQHRKDQEHIEARGVDYHDDPEDVPPILQPNSFVTFGQTLCACGHAWDDHQGGRLRLSCQADIFDGTRQCMCLTFRKPAQGSV